MDNSYYIKIIPSEKNPLANSGKSIFNKNAKITTINIKDLPAPSLDLKKENLKIDRNSYYKDDQILHHFENIQTDLPLKGPTGNSFFDTFFLAYTLHGDVVISPDDIWLAICF
jgi:hypothetical protein